MASEQRQHAGVRPNASHRDRADAAAADDFSTRVVWTGEGVDLIEDIPSASDIVDRVVAEAVIALRDRAALNRSA
jgi:hypothetical protein